MRDSERLHVAIRDWELRHAQLVQAWQAAVSREARGDMETRLLPGVCSDFLLKLVDMPADRV